MKTIEELRQTEQDKLLDELKELQKELFQKRFEVKNDQVKDSHTIKLLKNQVARIKTILKEKEGKELNTNQQI